MWLQCHKQWIMASTNELLGEVGIAMAVVWAHEWQVFTMRTPRRGQTGKLGTVSGTSTYLLSVGFFILVPSSRHGSTRWGQRKQWDSVCSCKEKREVKLPDIRLLNHFLINYLSGYFRGKCFLGPESYICIFVKCDICLHFQCYIL